MKGLAVLGTEDLCSLYGCGSYLDREPKSHYVRYMSRLIDIQAFIMSVLCKIHLYTRPYHIGDTQSVCTFGSNVPYIRLHAKSDRVACTVEKDITQQS